MRFLCILFMRKRQKAMTSSALIYSTSKNRSNRCALYYSCTTLYLDIRYIVLFIVWLQIKKHVQWSPALRKPALYGQFCLSRQKVHIFSLKLTRFIRTPVNTDNGHFSVSRVTNSHILSTPLYGHWLSAHCLFSLSQLCDNCRHCTLFK